MTEQLNNNSVSEIGKVFFFLHQIGLVLVTFPVLSHRTKSDGEHAERVQSG